MKLRAKVNKAMGPSTNYIGTIVDGQPVPAEQLPNPAWLEISEEGVLSSCFILTRLADVSPILGIKRLRRTTRSHARLWNIARGVDESLR